MVRMSSTFSKKWGRGKPNAISERSKSISIFFTVILSFSCLVISLKNLVPTTHTHVDFFRESEPFTSNSNNQIFQNTDIVKQYCKSRRHEVVHILEKQTKSITFLDIGGHEGKTTFPPLLCLPINHRVITVEPVKYNQHTLSRKGATMGVHEPSYQWMLVRGAFSNETRRSVIYVPGNFTDNASLVSSAAALNVARSLNYRGRPLKQDVELIRGDDILLSKEIYPNFIKVDVQGAEALVIQGMSKLLSINRNMLLFAEHDPGLIAKHGLNLGDAFRQMMIFGFKAYCHPDINVWQGKFVISGDDGEVTEEQISDRHFLWRKRCKDIVYWKMGI